MFFKKVTGVLSLLCAIALVLTVFAVPAYASDEPVPGEATDISSPWLVKDYFGITDPKMFFDKKLWPDLNHIENAWITLHHAGGIGSLYFIFAFDYGTYTITNEDTGQSQVFGENDFLHEFADLEEAFGTAPKTITLRLDSGIARLNELFVFSPGEVPDFVQKWEPPKDGETDLVLFSAHGDDEQLFFAGLLPYYAGELDYQVQVVYLTDHLNTDFTRRAEMLNGLWAVGVTTYPVFGTFPDLRTTTIEDTCQLYYHRGITDDQMLSFVVEQLRRFRPKVAVGHDVNGEYGHGMHMLYTDLLFKALPAAADPEQYPELAEQYGTWDVPKTYIHLYPENQIIMDWDQPLERFDGMTAYQVTRDLGFPCHWSQFSAYSWYYRDAPTSDTVSLYSPREYGLYRSLVGEDVQKNDFFENMTTYAQDAELAKQQAEEEDALPEETLPTEETCSTEAAVPQETLEETAAPPPPQPATPQEHIGFRINWWIVAAAAAALIILLIRLPKRRK